MRTIQVRDDLLRAMTRRQDNDVADDAVLALETCLLFLMGATDALARVAHHVLGIGGAQRNAAWQFPDWTRKVRTVCAPLADTVAPDSPGGRALTILRLLRNSIHADGLTPMAVGGLRGRDETLFELPADVVQDVRDAADHLGGAEAWGMRELLPGRWFAEPGDLFEALLPLVLATIDSLMSSMTASSVPRPAGHGGPWGDVFGPERLHNTLAQVGVRTTG